ncbi:hypothetical protein [Georgenia yuyongxinii]|uniref:Uncharacterized protein n=1 Tax=Georgenia yuyongxinii TaxID=2589797 RepID=A0A552WVR8_9MICO|nr:hypothetical protein [Georgenia yuyongxinii]TRW46393.1 hypothetical protein FJ693_05555 [Georgenia yuyongxinii]
MAVPDREAAWIVQHDARGDDIDLATPSAGSVFGMLALSGHACTPEHTSVNVAAFDSHFSVGHNVHTDGDRVVGSHLDRSSGGTVTIVAVDDDTDVRTELRSFTMPGPDSPIQAPEDLAPFIPGGGPVGADMPGLAHFHPEVVEVGTGVGWGSVATDAGPENGFDMTFSIHVEETVPLGSDRVLVSYTTDAGATSIAEIIVGDQEIPAECDVPGPPGPGVPPTPPVEEPVVEEELPPIPVVVIADPPRVAE